MHKWRCVCDGHCSQDADFSHFAEDERAADEGRIQQQSIGSVYHCSASNIGCIQRSGGAITDRKADGERRLADGSGC